MDKLGTKPLHQLKRVELIVALRELNQQFSDYKFRTDQQIRDLEGEVAALLEADDGSYSPKSR